MVRYLTFALMLLALPTSSFALSVGIGDQNPASFTNPHFKTLKFKKVRYVTPWNGIYNDSARQREWLMAARAQKLQVLVAFNHATNQHCPARPCKAPSVRSYTKAFKAFRKAYPWVKLIQPWNEANSPTQPTYRYPKLAAQYYNQVKRYCKTCTVTAADLLDNNVMTRWLKVFKRYAKAPRLWGLHNYSDVNRFRSSGTRTLLKSVKGKIWFTETGGITYFKTASGKLSYPYNERRAARATSQVYKLAKISSRIDRVYHYHFLGAPAWQRFDAGLLRADGSKRPGWHVVYKYRKYNR